MPYDPETNLWKRGPAGSMYHSPPQANGNGGGFAGALKRKARGLSPLGAGGPTAGAPDQKGCFRCIGLTALAFSVSSTSRMAT